jgi:hypothetical protein
VLAFAGLSLSVSTVHAEDLADLFAYDGATAVGDERRVPGSAAYCYAREVRQRALQEIRELRRYAKIGGVLNVGAIEQQQRAIRAADYQSSFVGQVFKRERQRMLPCDSAEIRLILLCRRFIHDDFTRPAACTQTLTAQAEDLTTLTDAIQNGRL